MRDVLELPPWLAETPLRRDATVVVEGPTLAHLCTMETLRAAWQKVRRNNGMAGGDHETIIGFERHLDERLTKLGREMLTGRYRPSDVQHVSIPKLNGTKRWLTIPSVVDRVAQTAALLELAEPIDRHMSETSWGYRTGRGVPQALAQVEAALQQGLIWVVDADIKSYFDRVPHDRLMNELAIWIDDERLLVLFGVWLKSFGRWGKGIAQGSPISPLLANVYLHPFDRLMGAEGFRVVRYADDFVILSPNKKVAERALNRAGALLKVRRLSLNPQKTQIVAPGHVFRFLGAELIARVPSAAGV